MSKSLFLGGSKDGEMIAVPDGDLFCQVHVAPEPALATGYPSASTRVDFQIETYARQRLRGETRTFEVFVPTGWNGDDLIARLIERASAPS